LFQQVLQRDGRVSGSVGAEQKEGGILGEQPGAQVQRLRQRVLAALDEPRHQEDRHVAGGAGVTPDTADELFRSGVDVLTSGNHVWDKREIYATLEADVVIVGSGAGGGVSADLLSAAGLRVIIVEEGPLFTTGDFRMREADAYPALYQESAARKTADKAINILQGRCVGGSTTVNWTSSFRTPPATLARARRIALDNGIRYAYTGNVHDPTGGTTFCPACHEPLIVRDWYEIPAYRLTDDGHCPHCGAAIAGRFQHFGEPFGARRIPVAMGA